MATGIDVRHQRSCRSREGRRCNCTPAYQAHVFDKRTGKRPRKTFTSMAAAKAWRTDMLVAIRRGVYRAPSPTTLGQALDVLLDGMRAGTILDRSGNQYKPATCRSYAQAAKRYIEPVLGSMRLDEVQRRHVQALVDDLRAQGLQASTIHNKLDPLRVVFRRAVRDEMIVVDPTDGLELPAIRGRRQRVVSPIGAEGLIAAVPEGDRALWACALYAGLRRGELRALRWEHVDFEAGLIRVCRGWDDVEGDQDVKTEAGRRDVPLAGLLRKEMAAHKLRTGRSGGDLVFGRTASAPFVPSSVRARALAAWKVANDKAMEAAEAEGREPSETELLRPLTPHEARHTFASYLIASGMDPKQVQTYVGHTDIRTTYNVYGHLLPGDLDTARAALDALLEPAATRAVSGG